MYTTPFLLISSSHLVLQLFDMIHSLFDMHSRYLSSLNLHQQVSFLGGGEIFVYTLCLFVVAMSIASSHLILQLFDILTRCPIQ